MGSLLRCLPRCSSYASSSRSLVLFPSSIDPELSLLAEERVEEILWILQPSLGSVSKRKEVIDYIQRLVNCHYATVVFPFGSVPLKTYLPDGDIDLTVLSPPNIEEDLATEVCNILQYEEQKPESEVKDVQYIQAQVKIVKCSVKNISVDISFNQMAGISSLCFLEEVDQLIGKDHLFKKSIILIKAWCYYEARILGAYYNLLATYALEVLVLYIINAFHSSLSGPFAVLHKFLEYYSTFDWDNCCVTINGPIAVSSLPEIIEPPNNNVNGFLLSPEALKSLKEKLLAPINAIENGGHEFLVKHMNIVDPLKGSNNLGRSVSKGNLYRIKGALSYGFQNLVEIFTELEVHVGAGLENFFVNSLDRVRRGERPDTPIPVPAFGTGRSDSADLTGGCVNNYSGLLLGQLYHNYSFPVSPWMAPPLSTSQFQQGYTWDALSESQPCQQNVLFYTNTNEVISRVIPCYPYETGKSRGTGTFIPDVNYEHYRNMLLWSTAQNPDSVYPFSSNRMAEEDPGSQKAKCENVCSPCPPLDQFKSGSEIWENGCCMDLSMDQFPCLPCPRKSVILGINQQCGSEKRENDCLDSPQMVEGVESSAKAKSENGSCPNPASNQFTSGSENRTNGYCRDLSLDQFPCLSCPRKSVILGINRQRRSERRENDCFNSPQMSEEVESNPKAKSENSCCCNPASNQFKSGSENGGNWRCLDLSLDQFSLIACSRKSKSLKINQFKTEKRENGSSIDLLLDQFPPLPCVKKFINQSCHPIMQSSQAKCSVTSLKSIKFGTFTRFPSRLTYASSVTKN